MVGGPGFNSSAGAVWVWTRSGGVWTQQGPKLVGTGASGPAEQGFSVSLSADGNTAVVGGIDDSNFSGAIWVWTRSGGVWSQQGSKLFGTGQAGPSSQGWSVSLSADGNVAVVGGYTDDSTPDGFVGATWVWRRSGGVWNQQGTKLIGSGAVGAAEQGFSVSISADGNTALVGGDADDSLIGAAWVFAASDLTITKSHAGNFHLGDTGDTYTITATNSGPAATSGTLIVTDAVPSGLTPTGPNGAVDGWSCTINGQTLTCTRSDVLASGGSYPAITLTVNVANNAPASVTNTAMVLGGGEINTDNDSVSDGTTITAPSIPAAPSGVNAVAVTSTQVNVVWTPITGATYQIDRRAAGGGFVQIGASLTNSFSDTTALADSSYLYLVRAVNGAGTSSNSAADLATTVIFVDPALGPTILVKAVHLSQLRTAVNAVRLLAGIGATTFTDPATAGTLIRAVHITEIRLDLDAARGSLGLSTGGYTDSSLGGVAVKAVHFQEVRNRVQ
jgi:uncharacterized repeat protein (TIGR01451 family)